MVLKTPFGTFIVGYSKEIRFSYYILIIKLYRQANFFFIAQLNCALYD